MRFKRCENRPRSLMNRRAAAAIEAALMLPIILLVSFGSIDIAQYINVSQLVANASREGARIASRQGTETTAEVEEAVLDYLADALPKMSRTELAAGAVVQVRQKNNQAIDGGDLDKVTSGDPFLIRVSFDFSAVRWLSGPDYWNGNIKESTTFCRRE